MARRMQESQDAAACAAVCSAFCAAVCSVLRAAARAALARRTACTAIPASDRRNADISIYSPISDTEKGKIPQSRPAVSTKTGYIFSAYHSANCGLAAASAISPALSARRITAAASLGLRLRRRAGPGAAGFCLLNCIFIRCTFRF